MCRRRRRAASFVRWKHTGSIRAAYGQHTGSIRAAYRQHTGVSQSVIPSPHWGGVSVYAAAPSAIVGYRWHPHRVISWSYTAMAAGRDVIDCGYCAGSAMRTAMRKAMRGGSDISALMQRYQMTDDTVRRRLDVGTGFGGGSLSSRVVQQSGCSAVRLFSVCGGVNSVAGVKRM